MLRTTEAVHTHFFSAIRAFSQLELMRTEELIEKHQTINKEVSAIAASKTAVLSM